MATTESDRVSLEAFTSQYNQPTNEESLLYSKRENDYQESLREQAFSLAKASEMHDEFLGHHLKRMNLYAAKLSQLLGLEKDFVDQISIFAQLHDVGKLHISPSIMNKKGKLTPDEFTQIKKHTLYGPTVIGEHHSLAMGREIAMSHHEKWNGSGYPHGLIGEKIPLSARIVAIADVFDVHISSRPYKPAYSYEQTFEFMTQGSSWLKPNQHFDPTLLNVFAENYEEFTQIHQTFADENSSSQS